MASSVSLESLDDLLSGYGGLYWSRLTETETLHVEGNLRPKHHMASFYSGWDAYVVGVHNVAKGHGSAPTFFHASEIVPERQRFLLRHDRELRPRHVFGDHCARVQSEVLLEASSIFYAHLMDAAERMSMG